MINENIQRENTIAHALTRTRIHSKVLAIFVFDKIVWHLKVLQVCVTFILV